MEKTSQVLSGFFFGGGVVMKICYLVLETVRLQMHLLFFLLEYKYEESYYEE